MSKPTRVYRFEYRVTLEVSSTDYDFIAGPGGRPLTMEQAKRVGYEELGERLLLRAWGSPNHGSRDMVAGKDTITSVSLSRGRVVKEVKDG